MNNSYLIQRLLKKEIDLPTNLAFGLGGGQFKTHELDIIRKAFSFDYMGSSEFEFGAVPKSMNRIWDHKEQFVCGRVKLHYKYEDYFSREKDEGNGFVYYICRKEDESEVKARLAKWAMEDNPYVNHTKERIGLSWAMSKVKPEASFRPQGWIEIDNDFFFFIDKKMFKQTARIFRIPITDRSCK